MTEMLTDKEYQDIAKKILLKSCTGPIVNNILKDPIKFGTVVSAVMTADWKWDGRGTIHGYRKQYAMWTIYKLIKTLKTDKPNHKSKTKLLSEVHQSFTDNIKCNRHPLNVVEDDDYLKNINKKIVASKVLTDMEKNILLDRVEGITVSDISRKYSVSYWVIKQAIDRIGIKIGNSLNIC